MNALQYKDGKFWLVPNVPPKQGLRGTPVFGWEDTYKALCDLGDSLYDKLLEQALSNSIEVADESVELATELFAVASDTEPMNMTSADGCDEEWFFDFDHLDGQMFPIEGLTYNTRREDWRYRCFKSNCDGDGACLERCSESYNKEVKQVAIINN